MHIFITGATGLIGSRLTKELIAKGDQVSVLSRNATQAKDKLGDRVEVYESLSALKSFDGFDAIVNLAGEPIAGKRWTVEQKERLCQSRWQITQQIVALIAASRSKPKLFLSGSAIGYYGSQGDTELTEGSASHKEFTHDLCERWESIALQAASESTQVCVLRTGIVLAQEGGMLPKMMLPFQFFMGAVVGGGKQYISWIHIDDMVGAILFLLDKQNVSGVFNMTAPTPVTNRDFSFALSAVLHRPCLFGIPASVVLLAMGERATLLVDGQRAIPQRLVAEGYVFRFQNVRDAFRNLLQK